MTAVEQPALQIEALEKRFGAVAAVDGVDVVVRPGEFVTLLGPSGCGKSTLLRIVAGIEVATAGLVKIAGDTVSDPARRILVPPEKRQLGMVFQSYAVWPHMSVARNVAYPLKFQKVPRAERGARVVEALEAVHMGWLGDRYPNQLSGGQQQRVALARAIVGRPKILLLDEPLSNLDARLREVMRMELKRLHIELGLTMLYVTHDQSEALAMSDRILVMDGGKVLQEGSPEDVYANPSTLTVAKFLGVKNMLRGVLAGPNSVRVGNWVIEDVRLAEGFSSVDAEVTVALRPDAITCRAADADELHDAADGRMAVGVIDVVEFLGVGYDYEIEIETGVRIVVHTMTKIGDRHDKVVLRVDPGGAVAFPQEP